MVAGLMESHNLGAIVIEQAERDVTDMLVDDDQDTCRQRLHSTDPCIEFSGRSSRVTAHPNLAQLARYWPANLKAWRFHAVRVVETETR
jgi:hypothetical protein